MKYIKLFAKLDITSLEDKSIINKYLFCEFKQSKNDSQLLYKICTEYNIDTLSKKVSFFYIKNSKYVYKKCSELDYYININKDEYKRICFERNN